MSDEALKKPHGLRAYFARTRDPLNSVILVLPLFVAYQIGILGTGGIRNGVDFMTDLIMAGVELVMGLFFAKVGPGLVLTGYLGFNLVVLGVLLLVVWLLRNRGTFNPRLWPFLLLESTVYAIFFGSTIHFMMQSVGLDGLSLVDVQEPVLAAGEKKFSPFVALVTSIGAGLYEEIVFRAGLLGGLYYVLDKHAKVGRFGAAAIAVVVSSVIFSAVHHLGPMGDPFTLGVFTFRFFAGVLLSVIFTTRGFAVAVYTHAIYDVIVMILR